MARIIGIDYGTKRVGIAVSDPGQMIAAGLQTVRTSELFEFLDDYIRRESVENIVVGYPKHMNNKDSELLFFIKQFESKFKKKYPHIPFIYVDERFTSKLAMDAMIRGGMKKKERRIKENMDKISAAIILQSYLERRQK